MRVGEELERGCRSLLSSWNAAETNKQDNQLGKHRGHECTASPPPHPKLNDRWRPERVLERLKRREGTHRGRANGRISAQYWLYVTVRTKNHNRSTEKQSGSRSFFSSRGSLLVYKVCCVCEGRAAWFPAAEVDPWHQSVCLPAPLQSISNIRKKEKKKSQALQAYFHTDFRFFFRLTGKQKYSAIRTSMSGINENVCTCLLNWILFFNYYIILDKQALAH